MEEGCKVSGRRIRECFRYGVEELRIVYGSAERAVGTLRQGVQEAIQGAAQYVSASSFRDSFGIFAGVEESTQVRIKLASNPHPQAQDENMVFSAFSARYDPSQHLHEPYFPLRSGKRALRTRPGSQPSH